MDSLLLLVVLTVAIALFFDFLNGFHDAANAISTVVIARTLTPFQAVLLAGAANFAGYFTFGTAVATTVGKGVVDIGVVVQRYDAHLSLLVVLAGLLGAAAWDVLTWLWGLPTSSSHALIGGLLGSGLAAAGAQVVIVPGVLKIVSFIFLAPLLGVLIATLVTTVFLRVFRRSNPPRTARLFRRMELVSVTAYCLSHGVNDAQKTMGIIAMALVAGGLKSSFGLDHWVVFSCYAALSLGTVFGGWRIVKTMGTRITKITAKEGFCAELSAATILLATARLGIPVSTTHVIAGSIMGVGQVARNGNVRWMMARKILWAWLLTIPASAACAAVAFWGCRLLL
jgi:inorganic phosphate transporter, PiT family